MSAIARNSLFARREARPGLNTLFVLCTELRTIADIADAGVATAKLQWWRSEIVRALEGEGEHPLAPALARYRHLPAEYFMEFMDSVQMDIDRQTYANLPELGLYLHRSGGMPAALTTAILGYTDPATERFAEQLGAALRLVEIIRNLRADACKGRV